MSGESIENRAKPKKWKNPKYPNLKNMDVLLEYLPYFNNPKNNFYGIIPNLSQLPFYNYSEESIAFYKALYHENMIQMFKKPEWNDETRKYFNDPELIGSADLVTIQKLFTTILRADRSFEGLIAEMIDRQIFLKLLIRLKEIRESIVNKTRGSIIGLAVGDALGVPLEFKPPKTFQPVEDMIGGGAFDLKPGEWTDDTSMALCSAESLIEKKRFDTVDQLEKFSSWYKEGHLSVNGKCFDIGNTTRESLNQFEKTHEPYPGPDHERSAGNGSIMRLAPVPLFYFSDPVLAIETSAKSSRTTHGHVLAVDACRYMAGLIIGCLIGESKEKILSKRYSPVDGYWKKNKLAPEIDEVACGSFKDKNPPEIKGSGFVVKSLEAALWAFYNGKNFEDGCLMAVNLGDDADTTGAIYGQIAGAYYGESGIPDKWQNKLVKFDVIDSILNDLITVQTSPKFELS